MKSLVYAVLPWVDQRNNPLPIAVRHNQTVKGNGSPALLAEPGTADLAGLAQHDRFFWNEYVVMVAGIYGIRRKYLNRADRIAIKPIHQNCVERQTLINYIRLAHCLVNVDLRRAFVVRGGNLLACGPRYGQAARLIGLHCGSKGILGRW